MSRKKVYPSGGNWEKMEKEEINLAYLDGLLSTKTVDEKGHFDRQNVKFKPEISQMLAMVMSKKIRPEARNTHDLIRGYVEKMVRWDIQKECQNESELSQVMRKVLSVSHNTRDEFNAIHCIESEIDDVFSESHTMEEAKKRLSGILLSLPPRFKKRARQYFNRVKSSAKIKDRRNSFINCIDVADEELGEEE